MRNLNSLLAGALAAATVLVAPAANAATAVQVIGAGSSAIFNTFTLGAFALAGTGAQHYSTKGTCTSGNCAQLFDGRSPNILPEGGNLAVVWTADQSQVWAYISVDSVVGNRSFFAVPRATLELDAENEAPGNPQNLLPASLFGGVADAQEIPPAVFTALNNTTITTGFTDIRPEDAEFASNRVLATLNTTDYSGLGYGPGPIGTPIKSDFSSSQANPVAFSISGSDPITGQSVPPFQTISIGATPVMIVVNKTNPAGLGTPGIPQNTTTKNLRPLFEGLQCLATTLITGAPANVPLTVVLREPLSGTMNTFEFTNIRLTTGAFTAASQEHGINPNLPNNNPLNLNCPGRLTNNGIRKRAIGTGEVIKNGVMSEADSVGYAFFSFGNVAPIAGSSSYGYLTLNGVDPIQSTFTNGVLPTCNNPCPAAPNTTFPNLRKGTYRSWSVLRAVAAPGDNNTVTLINYIQSIVDSTVPDFVPFNPVVGSTEKGLGIYRSHYFQSGVAPNNGLTNPALEAGGDMGGCIEKKVFGTGVLGCHQ